MPALLQFCGSNRVCEFVRCLKPTQCYICLDRQRHRCYCWLFLNTALLHRWMSAGDGSSAGVCALPGAHRVPHVSRWAAVCLLLLNLRVRNCSSGERESMFYTCSCEKQFLIDGCICAARVTAIATTVYSITYALSCTTCTTVQYLRADVYAVYKKSMFSAGAAMVLKITVKQCGVHNNQQ